VVIVSEVAITLSEVATSLRVENMVDGGCIIPGELGDLSRLYHQSTDTLVEGSLGLIFSKVFLLRYQCPWLGIGLGLKSSKSDSVLEFPREVKPVLGIWGVKDGIYIWAEGGICKV